MVTQPDDPTPKKPEAASEPFWKVALKTSVALPYLALETLVIDPASRFLKNINFNFVKEFKHPLSVLSLMLVPAGVTGLAKLYFLHLALTNPILGISGFIAAKVASSLTVGKIWSAGRETLRTWPFLRKADDVFTRVHDWAVHYKNLAVQNVIMPVLRPIKAWGHQIIQRARQTLAHYRQRLFGTSGQTTTANANALHDGVASPRVITDQTAAHILLAPPIVNDTSVITPAAIISDPSTIRKPRRPGMGLILALERLRASPASRLWKRTRSMVATRSDVSGLGKRGHLRTTMLRLVRMNRSVQNGSGQPIRRNGSLLRRRRDRTHRPKT